MCATHVNVKIIKEFHSLLFMRRSEAASSQITLPIIATARKPSRSCREVEENGAERCIRTRYLS